MNRETKDSIGEDRGGAVEAWEVTQKPGLAIDLLPDGTRLRGDALKVHILNGGWELMVSRKRVGRVFDPIAFSGNN